MVEPCAVVDGQMVAAASHEAVMVQTVKHLLCCQLPLLSSGMVRVSVAERLKMTFSECFRYALLTLLWVLHFFSLPLHFLQG